MTMQHDHPAYDIFIGEITSVGTAIGGYVPHGFKEKTLSATTYGLIDKRPGRTGTSLIEPVVTLTGSSLSVGDLVFMRRRGVTTAGADGVIYECIASYIQAPVTAAMVCTAMQGMAGYSGAVVQVLGHDASGVCTWYTVDTC